MIVPIRKIHESTFGSLPEDTLPAAYLKSCLLPPQARRAGVSDRTQAQALDVDFLDYSSVTFKAIPLLHSGFRFLLKCDIGATC